LERRPATPEDIVAMIINSWTPRFRSLYGGSFPESYACVDCETSGLNFEKDLVIEFGACLVKDRVPVNRLNLVIDWTNHDVVPDDWLKHRLDTLARHMEEDGRSWRLTYDVLKREGVKPQEALEFVLEYLEAFQEEGILLASHNGYSFDERMLAANFDGFLGVPDFRFGENGMFDTGAIEKASQLPTDDRMLPRPLDTMESYFRRVCNAQIKGVRWNLDNHCMNKYRLFEKKGVDRSQCHTAGFDAYLVHLLMEEYRSRVTPDVSLTPGDLAEAAEAKHEAVIVLDWHSATAQRHRGQRRS
jgi:hypothetical protein